MYHICSRNNETSFERDTSCAIANLGQRSEFQTACAMPIKKIKMRIEKYSVPDGSQLSDVTLRRPIGTLVVATRV